MGWKKDYKKFQKDKSSKKTIFDYSDGSESYILWERSIKNVTFWNVENLTKMIDEFNDSIEELTNLQEIPEKFMNGFSWFSRKYDFEESYFAYPCASDFKNTYNFLLSKLDEFTSILIIAALTKFCYYTTEKFWKVMNYTFSSKQKQETTMFRIYEVMNRTSLEMIENMLTHALILCNESKVIPYKQHLLVEEIIDLGDKFTYHWSKMFDQVIDLTVESIQFAQNYGYGSAYYSNYNDTDQTENFEDFYEKTKTIVYNDNVNEAFSYFDLTKFSTLENFKKVYRKKAKQFHPDVNPDPQAAIEMKKINVYKSIIEQYFNKYDDYVFKKV